MRQIANRKEREARDRVFREEALQKARDHGVDVDGMRGEGASYAKVSTGRRVSMTVPEMPWKKKG